MIKISVILPTRKRVSMLEKAIESLLSLAHEPNSIEILLGVDNDDAETKKGILLLPGNIKAVYSDRMQGYTDLWRHQNKLSDVASGELLLSFSDDNIMITDGWDSKLLRHSSNLSIVRIFSYKDTEFANMMIFTAIHKGVYEILGHLALNTHMDTWLEIIGKAIPQLYVEATDIFIEHMRNKVPLDETGLEGRNCWGTSHPALYNEENTACRTDDIRHLKKYIELFGLLYSKENIEKYKKELYD